MNRDAITIEDCIDMYDKKNKTVILEAGHVVKFTRGQKKRWLKKEKKKDE